MAPRELSRRSFLLFPFFHRKRIVDFRVIRHGHLPARQYLLIHGNEETARAVLEEHMRTHAGVAHLVKGHERNVKVDGGVLDPNRMFSHEGAEKNLLKLNPGWTPEHMAKVLPKVDAAAQRIVRDLTPPPGGRIVALHNNSEGYSVRDELEISDEVSLKQPDDPHAFFLCADPADYAMMRQSPYNVVLQKNGPKEDDGSLSRLAAKRGIRYVNLEVALGNAAKQREMLEWLEDRLR